MQVDQHVLAGEQPGVITALEIRQIGGQEQVYYINVKIGKQKTAGTYSPFDVKINKKSIINAQDQKPEPDRT